MRDLVGRPFPLELFTRQGLRTKQVEAICRAHMPELSKKVFSFLYIDVAYVALALI